jgi:hypothetical protein
VFTIHYNHLKVGVQLIIWHSKFWIQIQLTSISPWVYHFFVSLLNNLSFSRNVCTSVHYH